MHKIARNINHNPEVLEDVVRRVRKVIHYVREVSSEDNLFELKECLEELTYSRDKLVDDIRRQYGEIDKAKGCDNRDHTTHKVVGFSATGLFIYRCTRCGELFSNGDSLTNGFLTEDEQRLLLMPVKVE